MVIRHNVSSRGIEDAVAISTKIFILEIAAAGGAGLATTKCRIATLPSVARNDNRISEFPFLSAILDLKGIVNNRHTMSYSFSEILIITVARREALWLMKTMKKRF